MVRDALDSGWYGEVKPKSVLCKVNIVPLTRGTYRDVERWENHERGFKLLLIPTWRGGRQNDRWALTSHYFACDKNANSHISDFAPSHRPV